ncbi:MAG: hypothetical protein AAGA77_24315, partial [Bacteroidota bacterium]
MKNLIITILLFIPVLSNAQDTLITESDTIITNTGIIEVDQVEVIKAFEANLEDAKRIYIQPKIKPVIPVDKTYNYDITIVPLRIDYPDPIIKPLAMNPDPPKSSKNFYSRLGYGNLNSPYADISYYGQRGDELEYAISGHYFAAEDVEEIQFRKFSESELNINVGYRLGENHKLTFDFNGGYDLRNLYDTAFVNTEEILSEDEVRRNILTTRARIGISNIETTDGNFNYGLGLSGQRIQFRKNLEYSENGFGIDLFVENQISSTFTLYVEGDGALHSISYASGESRNRNAFTANPGLRFTVGNFQLDAAADIFIDDNQTSPFADIEASYSFLDNSLRLYAGVDQVAFGNTLWNHYQNNSFVNGFIEIDKTSLSKQYYGGLSGKLRDFLKFNFKGGYSDISNQFYYENTPVFRLIPQYTDITNVFINANIEFNLSETIALGANVNQNFYSVEELNRLPNTPEFRYTAFSKIKLLDNKLTFSTDLNLMDKISFLSDNGEEILGNNQLDLSIG